MKIAITITLFIAISAVIFLLGLVIRWYLYNLIDKRIERFQSELIEKQICETQNMYKQMRGWRHDYRNHIQNMKIQLYEKNLDKLDSYLDELASDLNTVDTVIKTGNVMADAIINSKIAVAQKHSIKLNIKVKIPDNILISDVELCAVLGNLIDNATEACVKMPVSTRFMRIYISTLKNQLYISVQNSANEVKRDRDLFISTKGGEHGYGIFRIDRISKKYGGYVNRQYEEGIFATELMIPQKTVGVK